MTAESIGNLGLPLTFETFDALNTPWQPFLRFEGPPIGKSLEIVSYLTLITRESNSMNICAAKSGPPLADLEEQLDGHPYCANSGRR